MKWTKKTYSKLNLILFAGIDSKARNFSNIVISKTKNKKNSWYLMFYFNAELKKSYINLSKTEVITNAKEIIAIEEL